MRRPIGPMNVARRRLLRPAAALVAMPFIGAGCGRGGSSEPEWPPPGVTIPVSHETVVADMALGNDLPLRGYEDRTAGWYVGPGIVQLGNDPRMTNAPEWFKRSHPTLVNDTYMRAFLPWVVIFDGVGHEAVNVRVELAHMRALFRSRAGRDWRRIGYSPGLAGATWPKAIGGAPTARAVPEERRRTPSGSVEVKPPADPAYVWHGWWERGRVPIEPTDIEAVFVTVQARLVVDDPSVADDRARARLLVQVGADYYYDENWQWSGGQPGVGTSRAKLVRNDWQTFNLFTFSDVGVQDPGGGISLAAFVLDPPPLD